MNGALEAELQVQVTQQSHLFGRPSQWILVLYPSISSLQNRVTIPDLLMDWLLNVTSVYMSCSEHS